MKLGQIKYCSGPAVRIFCYAWQGGGMRQSGMVGRCSGPGMEGLFFLFLVFFIQKGSNDRQQQAEQQRPPKAVYRKVF